MSARVVGLYRSPVTGGFFAGSGKIDGDVRTITPDAPRRCRVALLLHNVGGPLPLQGAELLAWTVADEAGNYRFDNLAPPPAHTRYAVMAYDPAGEFAPAIKTHLVPDDPEDTP